MTILNLMPENPGDSELQKRSRAYKRTDSDGCITCRTRRVKCDESKPSCEKCVKAGRTCDGYLPDNHGNEHSKAPTLTDPKFGLCKDQLIVVDISGTSRERSCFEFFRSYTIPQLSGFDTNFWNRLLLQATHHEPAIRHAAIALGSLHQRFESDKNSVLGLNKNTDSDGFALQQYVKAIRLLIQPIHDRGKQAADVVLMTCVLFICFEMLRGRPGSALSHINCGVKIIAELSGDTVDSQISKNSIEVSKRPFTPLATLKLVFVRLDYQASQIVVGRHRELLSTSFDHKERGYQADIPYHFSSLDEARNALDYLPTATMRALQVVQLSNQNVGPTPELAATLRLIRDFSSIKLRQWSQAFEMFLRHHAHDFDKVSQESIHITKLRRILLGVFFDIQVLGGELDERIWDSYYVEFETMVVHATAALKMSTCGSKGAPRPAFSLDTTIILPLYFVAAKCRHPSLRRKSVLLLKSASRQEGILNSSLTGRIAERLIEIEEEGLGEISCADNVPNWARLSTVDVKFEPEGRRAFLEYIRCKTEGGKRNTVQEWLEW